MSNNDAVATALAGIEEATVQSKSPAVTGQKVTDIHTKKQTVPPGEYTEEWLEQALEQAEVTVYYTEVREGIKYFYVPCPNEASHTGETKQSDAYVCIWNGWPKFKCWHGHCTEWKFADFAQAVGIEYRKRTGRVPDNQTHYYSDFYEWSKRMDGTEYPSKVIDLKVCNWICENYDFFVMGELPYFLDDHNCYVLDEGGAKMKRLIQSCIVPRLCKDSAIRGIYHMILYQDCSKRYEDLNNYPDEYVPFQNGFYDPIHNTIIPIRPEDYVINMIPHEYHPEVKLKSSAFDELLQFQLPDDDDREMWLEYCGSCFNRDISGQHWMIIRGPGGTGKSVQLNVLGACIGLDNIANETLQGLNERFAATALFGKLVNICADISSEDMKKVDVLKKVTGEDQHGVKHERKGKDSFMFTPFCKLLFSANEIPLNRDEKSNAFYRRLLIAVMDRKPEGTDRNLTKKLLKEIDGIIQRYMEALQRFYQRGGYYVESKRSVREVRRLQRSADSVVAFMDDELEADMDGKIERGKLYSAYKSYCEREERLYPVTRNKLFDHLRDGGLTETKDRHGQRYFVGIRFREGAFESVESSPFV